MEPDLEVAAAVRRINDRFLRLGKSTAQHEIKAKLGSKRGKLDELVREQVIQVTGSEYLPCLEGVLRFEENGETRAWCMRWTALALNTLHTLYVNDGERPVSSTELRAAIAERFGIAVLEEDVRVGMLFATEFPTYLRNWGHDSTGPVSFVQVGEGILDFDRIELAWPRERQRRAAAKEAVRPGVASQDYDAADLDVVGVYLRRRFDQDLKGRISTAGVDAPLSLVVLDLDNFKRVNDTLGHSVGDSVLTNVAARLRSASLGKGFAYRWGGDEFTILLPNCQWREAVALAERIREDVEFAKLGVDDSTVTLSVGVATYPQSAEKAEDLFVEADRAMYAAKGSGRNCVRNAGSSS